MGNGASHSTRYRWPRPIGGFAFQEAGGGGDVQGASLKTAGPFLYRGWLAPGLISRGRKR